MRVKLPLVSVIILTYNRKNELRNTLQKVFSQSYVNIEVIVIDNASDDGTELMIKENYRQIIYYKLNDNIGAPGYNYGFEKAKGKYFLVLDDDSYPLKYTLSKAIKIMEEDEKTGVGALNIFNTRYKITETDCFNDFAYSFIGCGVVIRKTVLQHIGFYNQNYFLYHNELDMSARVYNAGYKIRYLKTCKVIHNQSPFARGKKITDPITSEFRYQHMLLSYSIFLILNCSVGYLIREEIKWLINRVIICFKYPYLKTFFRGLISLLRKFPKLLEQRKVINPEVQKFYYNQISFIDRDFFPSFKRK